MEASKPPMAIAPEHSLLDEVHELELGLLPAHPQPQRSGP